MQEMETLWFLVPIFGFTHNMAFTFLNHLQEQPKKKQVQVRDPGLDLTREELELILKLLGQTSFQVKDIEYLYVALYKLQEQHKFLTNSK